MPAKSKSQQRLFGAAYSVRKGDQKLSDISPKGFREKVKEIVDSDMSTKDIKDYAETDTKNLPKNVNSSVRLPTLGSFLLEQEKNNPALIPMLKIVKSMKDLGYENSKILKVKNTLDVGGDGKIDLESLVNGFLSLGVDQDSIGNIIKTVLDIEKNGDIQKIYVADKDRLDDNKVKFYEYSFDEWKSVVDSVVKNKEEFDPETHKDPVSRPKHVYKSSDGEYYSALPNVTVYNTTDWSIRDFAIMRANDYK